MSSAFALELHRAECEFLTGELAAAEERLTMLSSRAANTVERATVACLRVDLYTTLDQSDRAVAVCLDYLRHMGVEWSPHPTKEEGDANTSGSGHSSGAARLRSSLSCP